MLGLRTCDSEKWKDNECVLCLIPPAVAPSSLPFRVPHPGQPPAAASTAPLALCSPNRTEPILSAVQPCEAFPG